VRTLFGSELSDAFLPGLWAFRRERAPSSPSLPQAAGLEEVPLGVRILP